MKTTLAMIFASLVLASAVASAVQPSAAPKAETPARLAYAFEAPIASDAAPADSMLMPEVRITAPRMPRKSTNVRAADGCAFGFRDVVQGPMGGQVRGFCN